MDNTLIVKELTRALTEARAGKIVNFVLITLDDEGAVHTVHQVDSFVITGAMEYAKLQILATVDSVLECQNEEDSQDGQGQAKDPSTRKGSN